MSDAVISSSSSTTRDEAPVLPVKLSENRRYFVDQKNRPVFWMGTTQWQLFREYSREDARTILEKTRERGFAFAQVMLLGVGDGTQPNVYGEKPFLDDDPLTPDEAYFRNVDAVMEIARELDVTISMTLYHQRYRGCITLENARAWAAWLATRYATEPALLWSMTPEAKPEFVPILRELAKGLRDGDGGFHLITFKPDPAPFASSFIHEEEWLDFNSMQTWKWVELIPPMVTKDYRMEPIKPVVMAEGAYEEGSEYGFDVTPLWVRRQAYYSYLLGASHAYGHNDSWRVLPTWKAALDATGTVQLGLLKDAFLSLKEWWLLEPDPSVLASGGVSEGQILNLGARHRDGSWLMAYLAEPSTVSLNLDRLSPSILKAKAIWIDPRDGSRILAGPIPAKGSVNFKTPDGWEDALLILEERAD